MILKRDYLEDIASFIKILEVANQNIVVKFDDGASNIIVMPDEALRKKLLKKVKEYGCDLAVTSSWNYASESKNTNGLLYYKTLKFKSYIGEDNVSIGCGDRNYHNVLIKFENECINWISQNKDLSEAPKKLLEDYEVTVEENKRCILS